MAPGINADPDSPTLRLAACGPTHPTAAFDCHLPDQLPVPAPTRGNAAPAPEAATTDHLTHNDCLHQDTAARDQQLGKQSGRAPAGRGRANLAVHGHGHGKEAAAEAGALRLELLAQEQPSPAARALLRRCVLLRGWVPSAGCERVPMTLLLPPGAQLPAGAVSEAGRSSSDASAATAVAGAAEEPQRVLWQVLKAAEAGDSGGSSGPGGSSVMEQQQQQRQGAGQPLPVLLYVYGAYGMPLDLEYDVAALAMAARGWAVARVHVRGGAKSNTARMNGMHC